MNPGDLVMITSLAPVAVYREPFDWLQWSPDGYVCLGTIPAGSVGIYVERGTREAPRGSFIDNTHHRIIVGGWGPVWILGTWVERVK